MKARKRKKAARVFIWRVLCLTDSAQADSLGATHCLHDSGYECHAQGRRERRALGALYGRRIPDRLTIRATLLQNHPPRLWVGDGAAYHQRYRNRRKKQ